MEKKRKYEHLEGGTAGSSSLSFNSLPLDMKYFIFEQLDVLTWYRISGTCKLWNKILIQEPSAFLSSIQTLNFNSFFSSSNVRSEESLHEQIPSSIISSTPNLTRLSWHSSSANLQSVIKLSQLPVSTKLKELEIGICKKEEEFTLQRLFQRLSQLEKLSINLSVGIQCALLHLSVVLLKNLTHFRLHSPFAILNIERILFEIPSLQVCDIYSSLHWFEQIEPIDHYEKQTNLRELEISNARDYTKTLKLMHSFPNLTLLGLSFSSKILQKIHFSMLSKLESLLLFNNDLTTKDLAPLLKTCSKLATLDVGGNSNLQSKALHIILKELPSLTNLKIKAWSRLSDEVLKVFEHFKQNKLKHLSIAAMYSDSPHSLHVTDIGISYIATCCLNLESLNVSGHEVLTDNAIKHIVTSCKNLRYLNLSGLTQLGPSSYDTLSTCQKLQCLVLSSDIGTRNSTNVSIDAVAKVMSQCNQLSRVILKWNRHVSQKDVHNLRQINPTVVIEY